MTSSSDRLDRVENDIENVKAIFFTVARRYEASEKRMEATDARLERLAERQDRTQQQLEQLAANADADRTAMFVMLEQMAALQQENKQILEYLFGQQRNGNGGELQA